VHVRAFSDGNGDGVGDFRGLTQELDYIKDLGMTAVWLLPAAEPQLHAMLRAYLLQRAMGELVDELSSGHGRPEVPLKSILFLVS
jgi:hypothetical protein